MIRFRGVYCQACGEFHELSKFEHVLTEACLHCGGTSFHTAHPRYRDHAWLPAWMPTARDVALLRQLNISAE